MYIYIYTQAYEATAAARIIEKPVASYIYYRLAGSKIEEADGASD